MRRATDINLSKVKKHKIKIKFIFEKYRNFSPPNPPGFLRQGGALFYIPPSSNLVLLCFSFFENQRSRDENAFVSILPLHNKQLGGAAPPPPPPRFLQMKTKQD